MAVRQMRSLSAVTRVQCVEPRWARSTSDRGDSVTGNETPEVQTLFERISNCLRLADGFHGVVYRSTGVRYASQQDFFSGAGAAAYGGRWNPPGINAVYASLDPVTAVRESYRMFLDFGFATTDIRPRVFCGAKVRLKRVLDLCNIAVRRSIGFSMKELVSRKTGKESSRRAMNRGHRQLVAGRDSPDLKGFSRHLLGSLRAERTSFSFRIA